MHLEDKIAESKVTFIHSMDYNWKEKRFILNLVKNSGSIDGINKRLTFNNVSNFVIDEEMNNSVDQIMEINEYKEDDKVKYVFLTEQRTFVISTDMEPLSIDLP